MSQLPLDRAILAGSGPSLDAETVHLFREVWPAPIVAVSSAIQTLQAPDIWITLHGPEWYGPRGQETLLDPHVAKVIPAWRNPPRAPGPSLDNSGMLSGRNVIEVPYQHDEGHGRTWLRHIPPLVYSNQTRRSLLFALAWLVLVGAREIVLAGVDLCHLGGKHHAHGQLSGTWRYSGEPMGNVAERGLRIELGAWREIVIPCLELLPGLRISRLADTGGPLDALLPRFALGGGA